MKAHEEWALRTQTGAGKTIPAAALAERVRTHPPRDVDGRTEEVFRAIVRYKQAHDGNSPTIRQIMAETSITSTSVCRGYLERLTEIGRIRMGESGVRSIEVVGAQWAYEGER